MLKRRRTKTSKADSPEIIVNLKKKKNPENFWLEWKKHYIEMKQWKKFYLVKNIAN